MPFCKECGDVVEKPFKLCAQCHALKTKKNDQDSRRLTETVRRIKEEARMSGNPKVFTSAECSQEFLRSLIPRS